MVAKPEELKAFRDELENMSIDLIKENINHERYGAPDRWKRREAEAFLRKKEQEAEFERSNKILLEAKRANELKEKSNRLAVWALIISILSFVISISAFLFNGK